MALWAIFRGFGPLVYPPLGGLGKSKLYNFLARVRAGATFHSFSPTGDRGLVAEDTSKLFARLQESPKPINP